jgi:hypothetical protein
MLILSKSQILKTNLWLILLNLLSKLFVFTFWEIKLFRLLRPSKTSVQGQKGPNFWPISIPSKTDRPFKKYCPLSTPRHHSNADADRLSCAESVPKNLFDLENSWNEGSMLAHYQPPAAARYGGGGTAGRLYGQPAGSRDCSAAQLKPDVRAARLPNSYHIINDDFPRTCCIASAECQ